MEVDLLLALEQEHPWGVQLRMGSLEKERRCPAMQVHCILPRFFPEGGQGSPQLEGGSSCCTLGTLRELGVEGGGEVMPQMQAKAGWRGLGPGRCLLSPRAHSPAALAMTSVPHSSVHGERVAVIQHVRHEYPTASENTSPGPIHTFRNTGSMSPLALVRLGVQVFYSELVAVTESSVRTRVGTGLGGL